MAKVKAHVSDAKKKTVKEFTDLIKKYDVVAAVDVENLPAKQLNIMRAKLRGTALLRMTKRRLITIALENSGKEGLTKLNDYLTGMPALLFTNENPFKLFKILKQNKSPAPIKAGQKAPKDIIVPAGPTGFAPGPIIGELGQLGIKAGIDGGKVAVKQDSIVAHAGDVVNEKVAAVLLRLGIMPMEIGLNVQAVFENGSILTKKDLDIDEGAFMNSLKSAASEAFSLSIAIGYTTKNNINQLLSKAHMDAYALADSQSIMTSDNVDKILAKADAQASALLSKIQ